MTAIPERANLALAIGFLTLHSALLFWPPLADTYALPACGGMLLFSGYVIVSIPLWALIHEAVHGRLLAAPSANRWLGKVLAVIFGGPYQILRYGHLFHHRQSRGPADRTEIYEPAAGGWWRAALVFYPRLLGGLYLAELAAGLFIFLPRRILAGLLGKAHRTLPAAERSLAERELLSAAALKEMRLDGALSVLFYLALFYFWRDMLWLPALAVFARAVLISLLDNSFHYGTPLDERLYALNLRLPPLLSRVILNFNFHRVHHRDVKLPWNMLPAAEFTDQDPGFVRALLRQLRGPLTARQLPR